MLLIIMVSLFCLAAAFTIGSGAFVIAWEYQFKKADNKKAAVMLVRGSKAKLFLVIGLAITFIFLAAIAIILAQPTTIQFTIPLQ